MTHDSDLLRLRSRTHHKRIGAIMHGHIPAALEISRVPGLGRDLGLKWSPRLIKATISVLLLVTASFFVARVYGFGTVADSVRRLSGPAFALLLAAIVTNVLAAGMRLKVLCSDTGHQLSFRQAISAVAAGGLGGAAFFQFAGQLTARWGVLRGMPFSAVVVVTLYERIVSAAISAALALAGALFIFGHVYLDRANGGFTFIKLVAGIMIAIACAAWFGFGQRAVAAIRPALTTANLRRLIRAAALTLAVQLPMMAAYVDIGSSLSPTTPIESLIAGSAIVMFAASVPISLAGWGIREMSAVFALGAIGVGGPQALTVALLVGAASLGSMAIVFGLTWSKGDQVERTTDASKPIDYFLALSWALPSIAAFCVLFQIYVPLASGTLLNVNLADPVAILGGCLLVGDIIRRREIPRWRTPGVNALILCATIALTFGLLHGYARIGWTQWAFINRYAGWFVLLAYLATGALIVRAAGGNGLRTIGLSYAGAMAGISLLEIGLLLAGRLGMPVSGLVVAGQVEGFSLNHNFFAFQLLIGCSVVLALTSGTQKRVLFGILLAAIWFAGSRSGWISIVCVVAAAFYVRRLCLRDFVAAVALAGAIAAVIHLIPSQHAISVMPQIVPTAADTSERMRTLVGGWELFISHPVFGAGMGIYRSLDILAQSGIPLVIHCSPLWLLAEMGVLGFALFALPSAAILTNRLKAARKSETAALAVLCIVGFGVMCGPADMIYQRTFWLILGSALAIPIQVRKAADQAIPSLQPARSDASMKECLS